MEQIDHRLLKRYIAGGSLSAAELKQVTDWLQSDRAHREHVERLHHVYDGLIWNAPPERQSQRTRWQVFSRYSWRAAQVAAAILAVLFLTEKFFVPSQDSAESKAQTVYVPQGQRVKMVLADGTTVWLNSNTTLSYSMEDFLSKKRRVKLDGEAHFEVTKDAEHPFVVSTPRYDVQVLGTTFNVCAYGKSDIFETSLYEGKVRLNRRGTTEELVLQPHEMASERGGVLEKHRVAQASQASWQTGVYSFDNETLDHVLKKLAVYYDIVIDNRNRSLSEKYCTCKFRQGERIEQIMEALQKYASFKYRHDKAHNRIVVEP